MTRSAARFIAYDHIVASDIAILGADRCPDVSSLPADIRITVGAPLIVPAADTDIYRLDGDTLEFQPPGVARYRCRRGEGIEVAVAIDADPDAVEALLIATALPALLWMRGGFVLHAAAVALPGSDKAIVIAGPSGIGKSTIVEQLVRRGARLIADDTVRVSLYEAAISVSGLCAGYFIRSAGVEHRRFQDVPTTARCHRAPLAALFFLSRGAMSGSVTRISGVDTVERLLANRHRPKVPDILGMQASGLRDCARMAHRVPAYHWQRREDFPALAIAEWEVLVSSVSEAK